MSVKAPRVQIILTIKCLVFLHNGICCYAECHYAECRIASAMAPRVRIILTI